MTHSPVTVRIWLRVTKYMDMIHNSLMKCTLEALYHVSSGYVDILNSIALIRSMIIFIRLRKCKWNK